MYTKTAASNYGPDYYQALLAQPEDEILNPRRSPGTQRGIQRVRKQWRRFCQEILQRPLNPEVDPVERLRDICLRDLQVFFRWFLQGRNVRKLRVLLSYVKSWTMMYRDDVGHSLKKEMVSKINTYSRTTLMKDFNLDPTLSPKESTNENDLHNLLIYLWTRDTHVYPVERQRIQQSFITLLIALTSVRPSALIESDSYVGTDEALRYRDVTLRLVRDPEILSQTVLLMEVTVTLWKGERETKKPVTFVFYEHECLMFCPVLHMLSLAFADNAFDSENIRSVQDIYSHIIPEFKESTLLRWKDEWMPRPIFRRACSMPGGLVTSSVKALPYQSYASQMSALGSGAGFRAGLTAYAFRRGAGQVINKIATHAERNQIMGHSNSYIYEKYYQNRVVSIDISAAVLKMPSRSSLLASVGHIGIDRDPRVPLHLDTEERDAALTAPEFVEIEARIKELHASIYAQHHRNTCKITRDQAQIKQLTKMRGYRNRLRTRLLNKATNEKRRQFFERIDNDDIHQAKSGDPVTYTPAPPIYALAARANLANIFVHDIPGVTTGCHRDRRIEALQNLVDLCHVREPHRMNPGSGASKIATAQSEDTMPSLGEVQNDVRDLRDAFETMELIPLVLPSTICLFCLGDADLAPEARTASFSRIDSLRRHIDDVHLRHYDPNVPLLCPHPSCDISFQSVDHFKNHAATVHNVFLSK